MSILGWVWLTIAVVAPLGTLVVSGYKYGRDDWDGEDIFVCIGFGFVTAVFAPLVVPLGVLAGAGYLIFGSGTLLGKRVEHYRERKIARLATDAEAIRRTRDMFDKDTVTWEVLTEQYNDARATWKEACAS